MLIYPIILFVFTVFHFSSVESLRTALVSLLREWLDWKIATQRLFSVTEVHPVPATVCRCRLPSRFPSFLVGRVNLRGACLGYSTDYTSQILCTSGRKYFGFGTWFKPLSRVKAFYPWDWLFCLAPYTHHVTISAGSAVTPASCVNTCFYSSSLQRRWYLYQAPQAAHSCLPQPYYYHPYNLGSLAHV